MELPQFYLVSLEAREERTTSVERTFVDDFKGKAHLLPATMLPQDYETKPSFRQSLAWVPLEHFPVGS